MFSGGWRWETVPQVSAQNWLASFLLLLLFLFHWSTMTLQFGKFLTSSTDLQAHLVTQVCFAQVLFFIPHKKGHSCLARDRRALVLGHGNLPHLGQKAQAWPHWTLRQGLPVPFWAAIKELICPAMVLPQDPGGSFDDTNSAWTASRGPGTPV